MALDILSQCAAGIGHLHAQGIIHRDIRADNMLVYSRDPFRLRVADFGLAHVMSADESYRQVLVMLEVVKRLDRQ